MNRQSAHAQKLPLSSSTLLLTSRPLGALSLAIGLALLSLLFIGTAGHRARLAVEILAVVASATFTAFFIWESHPATPLITRIYAHLSRHLRHVLFGAILMVYTLAVASAAAEVTARHIRAVFALGGIVTADWVLSLAIIASLGSALCTLGFLICLARPRRAVQVSTDVIVRLWAASNQRQSMALDGCFASTPAAQALCRRWLAVTGSNPDTQVLLIHCSRSGARWDSEWHAVRQNQTMEAPESLRIQLSCTEDANGSISGGEITLLPPSR
ncbi:MAG: hypothetical protein M1396_02040 [Chloroflexi bacterium]|nr:hypothetical protein [Chloroflexota bacterium]